MAHVMVVDDDEDFALAVATILVREGYEVETASSTGDALTRMSERRPDIVILDVMFPEEPCAGFAMAAAMRAPGSRVRDVPILLLTGVNARFPLGFSSRDIDGDRLPVSDFLEKPMDFAMLVAKVQHVLDKAGSASAAGSATP